MKKAVVTGGAGFIGSNLSDELAKRDYHVVIFDNLSTGHMENIDPLLKSGKAEFVEGTITDLAALQEVFNGADYVFHQARDNGVKKVVYASSSSVYGDTPTLPKTEDMMPHPLSPYAVTKLTGEYYCDVFARIYGLKTTCLRYFNVYGP